MGRDKRNERRNEHWTQMLRDTMNTEAWRALSPTAQALYPWLKLEWKGLRANNNGKLRLSTRQAGSALGMDHKAAARAFQDLQAKGFVVVTEAAALGGHGEAKSPSFELTEIALPQAEPNVGRKLYQVWQPGQDFHVVKASTNNPRGKNGKTKPCHQNGNAKSKDVPKKGTGCAQNGNEQCRLRLFPVPKMGTSLFYHVGAAMSDQLDLFQNSPKQRKQGLKMDLGHRDKIQVIPFPAKKRIGKARRVAEVIASKETQNAVDSYWNRITGDLMNQMTRAGVSEHIANREVKAFAALVTQLLHSQQRGSDSA